MVAIEWWRWNEHARTVPRCMAGRREGGFHMQRHSSPYTRYMDKRWDILMHRFIHAVNIESEGSYKLQRLPLKAIFVNFKKSRH
jgi:hypothetical protein